MGYVSLPKGSGFLGYPNPRHGNVNTAVPRNFSRGASTVWLGCSEGPPEGKKQSLYRDGFILQ